jgi:tight adherence protein B
MAGNPIFIILPVLLGAFLLVALGVRRRRPLANDEVMERMGRFATREEMLAVADRAGRREPGKLVRSLDDMLKGGSLAQRLSFLLVRSDVRMTVGELILLRVVTALGGFALGYFVLSGFARPLGLLIGLATGFVGYAAPYLYLSFRAKRRVKKFVNQLGDTITLMANSLRAGYSLLQTMDLVSRESPEPISVEFRRVVREIGLGVSNEDAMNNLLMRVPSEDLDLLVTAINIQHEVGGNLAQILSIIGHTIRERVRIKGEIAVLTAQQTISAYVITALPILLAIAIFFLNPSYMKGMFVWPYVCLPIGAVILVTIGFFVMKKITAIEV